MLADALRSLVLREPLASVALHRAVLSSRRALRRGAGSAEVPRLRHVANQDFSFKPGIDVTDVTQVKGLEFDYVILLDVTAATYPDTTESRHMLYIARHPRSPPAVDRQPRNPHTAAAGGAGPGRALTPPAHSTMTQLGANREQDPWVV